MSTSSRLISAFFTILPGSFFFVLFLTSGWLGREYWWGTYLAAFIVLLFSGLFFGSALPNLFQKLGLRHPWVWILAQGILAWTAAFFALTILNLTPLCVGQNNGDGNNDLGMCNLITALSCIVYTPVYGGVLAVSSLAGHWMLKLQLNRRE
ncbi:MAG: hypothetical protein DPW18_10040 [Chloroflexi bacterium]|nr:hypothetical protein [Chloroflexota bacterium]MDL1943318.1 hypothetical protein [Chloroflexi bacterium CFX2]